VFRHLHRRNMAGILAVGIACVSGASAYAFTASNTVPNHTAGVGQGTVSGYTGIDTVAYTYDPTGTHVEAVSFNMNAAVSSVEAALTSTTTTAQGDWQSCDTSGATSPTYAVTCTFGTPIPVGNANYLSIAAANGSTFTIAAS